MLHPLFRDILEAHGAPPAVVTSFDHPPIPGRGGDWSATQSDYDPERGGLIGRGATEQEAIDDLLAQIAEEAEIG